MLLLQAPSGLPSRKDSGCAGHARRTATSLIYQITKDPVHVRKTLGHSQVAFPVENYVNHSPEELRQGNDALAAVLFGRVILRHQHWAWTVPLDCLSLANDCSPGRVDSHRDQPESHLLRVKEAAFSPGVTGVVAMV